MADAFREINIFTYTEDDFRREIHHYLYYEFEVVSISIGIVRLHKKKGLLDQWIHIFIFTPVGMVDHEIAEIINDERRRVLLEFSSEYEDERDWNDIQAEKAEDELDRS